MNLKPLFIRIPKTASASIANTELFQCCAGRDYGMWDGNRHNRFTKILRDEISDWGRRFKFAFVRNPFDRVVSNWSSMNGRLFDMEFKTYIEFIKVGRATTRLEERILWHTCPMKFHLTNENGTLRIDNLGRYENLQEDYKRIVALSGVEFIGMDWIHKSNRSNYRDYYNSETKRIVEQVFLDDLNYFSYNF
jgi:chondroitin 4-sulfotransferase 11